MAEDFFGTLGKWISKATQTAVDKTSSLVESTKIGAQISGEQREIEKLFQKIGEAVIAKVESGEIQLGEEESAILDEIRAHKEKIQEFKASLASVKGMKICPSCEELIANDVAFCPKCGAPTPVVEPEEEPESEAVEIPIETVPDEALSEAAEVMDGVAEGVAEGAAEAAERAAEAVLDVAEAAEDAASEAADAFYETIEDAGEHADDVKDAAYEVVEEAVEEVTEPIPEDHWGDEDQ